MAIDTQQKRQSAATVGMVWNGPTIIPDGSFDQADRQHIGWNYTGNLVEAPAGVGAIMNQLQFSNLGADLFDGTLIQ